MGRSAAGLDALVVVAAGGWGSAGLVDPWDIRSYAADGEVADGW